MKKSFIYALAMVAATSTAVALADNHGDDDGDKKDRPHGPPIEALKACEGKSAGAKVQFENRNGRTMNGTCQLIAIPERLKGEGKKEGESGSQGQGVK
jgi:hypothetical protein